MGLEMFRPRELGVIQYQHIDVASSIRLGKLVEEFVFFELNEDPSVEILLTNLQIFSDRTTIGELDCLMLHGDSKIHLEIIYKFYLYDPSSPNELDRWIGPNRKDSLVKKVEKLKSKQLPMLHQSETQDLLNQLWISPDGFEQKVYFKAQLFVPLAYEDELPMVNNDCVKGFYIHQDELQQFSDSLFFIPTKLDWLIHPHKDVAWLDFDTFEKNLQELLTIQKAPMCWMQSDDGMMKKFFVVWW